MRVCVWSQASCFIIFRGEQPEADKDEVMVGGELVVHNPRPPCKLLVNIAGMSFSPTCPTYQPAEQLIADAAADVRVNAYLCTIHVYSVAPHARHANSVRSSLSRTRPVCEFSRVEMHSTTTCSCMRPCTIRLRHRVVAVCTRHRCM